MTTVGYGDHVPVTTSGRLIGAAVMVVGVAVIGAVAAIVALAVALHVALQEEQAFQAEAATLEHLKAWSSTSANDSTSDRRDAQ
jgi:voltage-gated potassium channel